jgi:hypothetical protein
MGILKDRVNIEHCEATFPTRGPSLSGVSARTGESGSSGIIRVGLIGQIRQLLGS